MNENENENLQPIQKLTPFTKMIMTIGTLPSSFYASMSYYESMVWLYEYLKNEIIPAVNNNGEAVEELQSKFIELKTFIDEYFDNLDVQEEINHKLDEMALDGTLTNLIKDYVDPIYEAYETRINEQVNGQNTTIDNFTTSVNTTLSEYNNKINGLFNYSPIPVSSTSDMQDTSKIYVNTTDGKWYYYDGDSWEIGGTYQASSNDDILNSESTNAVQNKIITSAVSNVLDITTEEETITEAITPTWTSGYIGVDGTVYESANLYHTNKINVNEGDTISIVNQSTQTGAMRFICAYDENDNPVPASGSSSGVDEYTVPSGIKSIVISNNRSATNLIILVLISHLGTTQKIKSKNEIENVTTKPSNISYNLTSGLINVLGEISTSAVYSHTNKITVNEGDIILINSKSTNKGARTLCSYIGDIPCQWKGVTSTNDNIYKYVVPKYIDSIRLSINNNASDTSIIKISTYNTKLYKNNNLGGFYYNGNIEQNEIIKFDYTNLKPSYNINFSANISSLDTIEMGYIDDNNNFFRLLSVDNTNLVVYNSGNQYKTEAHGLTIANDLGISMKVLPYINGYDRASVSIFSNGNEYTLTDQAYTYGYSIKGKLALKINNSVVSHASFSVGIENIDKPIWVFGDSWISNNTERWVRYLVKNNFNNNCFMNGYPGETSLEGLESLKSLLKLKQPKYLLWLYGMNDGDTNSAINSNYLTALNYVIELCQTYNISLILATIPNTPTINNFYKNLYVRNSGYRYFDEESAVTSNGSWISGYESQDGNHTTEAGAKALYYKLLTDVPEITNYN